MPVTHRFVSAKSDDADPTLIRPSNWNDTHAVDQMILTWIAAGAIVLQPASDPATGTELFQIKNAAGTVQSALSSDGIVYAGAGAVGLPGVTFELDKDTGLYRIAANTIGFATNGVERMRINTTGVSVDGGATYLSAPFTIVTASNNLAAGVAMSVAGTYYDGASVSLTAGTWLVYATATVGNGANAMLIKGKLWDGTTAYGSSKAYVATANQYVAVSMSALVTPGSTTTYKISVNSSSTSGTLAGDDDEAGLHPTHIRALKVA